jgi:hypothetical protein
MPAPSSVNERINADTDISDCLAATSTAASSGAEKRAWTTRSLRSLTAGTAGRDLPFSTMPSSLHVFAAGGIGGPSADRQQICITNLRILPNQYNLFQFIKAKLNLAP